MAPTPTPDTPPPASANITSASIAARLAVLPSVVDLAQQTSEFPTITSSHGLSAEERDALNFALTHLAGQLTSSARRILSGERLYIQLSLDKRWGAKVITMLVAIASIRGYVVVQDSAKPVEQDRDNHHGMKHQGQVEYLLCVHI